MKILRAPFALLSSKAFLLWMIGGWVVYYVMSAIWVKEAFGLFMNQLGENPLYQVPFVVFLLSGYGNLVRASIGIFKKSKLQFCASIILPVGLMLFFTGYFLSVTSRQAAQIIVGEGNNVSPPWSSNQYVIAAIDPGLKDRLSSADIHQGLFAYQPFIRLTDKAAELHKVGAFPPSKIDGTYYHILNFGIAPEINLLKNNRLQERGYMILRILEPGSSDFFEIVPLPYRFVVSMAPEKTLQEGDTVVSEFNLKAPSYQVTVYRGDKIVAEGNPEKDVHFDGFSLRFSKSTFWTQLEAVKDRGVAVLHAGIILLTIGIPVYLVMLIAGFFRQRPLDGV
jgi:hypothetical protein